MPRSRWDDDDDDRPAYRGPRDYESTSTSVGDVIGDALVSVKQATTSLTQELSKSEVLRDVGDMMKETAQGVGEGLSDLSERVGNEWQRASDKLQGEERRQSGSGNGGGSSGSRRMLGKMPPGCFCDMRGYACPMHRGREQWRFSDDFKQHVETNVDPSNMGTKATGIAGAAAVPISRTPTTRPAPSSAAPPSAPAPTASTASGRFANRSPEDVAKLDEAFATLLAMGFDADRIGQVLVSHRSVEGATNALLDDPHSTEPPSPGGAPPAHPGVAQSAVSPPRVSSSGYLNGSATLGAPPTAPPPPPPAAAASAAETLLIGDLLDLSDASSAAPPSAVSVPLASLSAPPSLLPPPSAALPTFVAPEAPLIASLAAPPHSQPHSQPQLQPSLIAPPIAQPAVAQSAAAPPATPSAAQLPPGWHQCSDPTSGRPYWFDTNTSTSHWTPPPAPPVQTASPPAAFSALAVLAPTHPPAALHTAPSAVPAAIAAPPATAPPVDTPPVHAPQPASASLLGGCAGPLADIQSSCSSVAALAASALPSMPPEGSMGALPAGWHTCTDPTHNRPYYFNTVTQQSQWTSPTAAAAVPLAMMPALNDRPRAASPGSFAKTGAEFGGVGDMAALIGLRAAPGSSPLTKQG